MAATYEPIATYTLPSSTTSVTFDISSTANQSYTDLVLVANQSDTGNGYIGMQFNGDTTWSNYSGTWLAGDGSTARSGRYTGSNGYLWNSMVNTNTTSIQTVNIFHIMNYSNNTTYKTVLARNSNAGVWAAAEVGLWRNTAAITSILVQTSGTSFVSGSTFSLYGIKAA